MTTAEFITACKECNTPQKAAELLRNACTLAVKYDKQADTIQQYAEQVERLTNEISDLTAELEDKRIQLMQYGDLDTLIGRLGVQVVRLEQTGKPTPPGPAPEPTPEPPPKPEKKPSKKADSKKVKGKANGFDDFWEAYPKKVDKQTARTLWDKLAPDNELKKVIIAAVKRQAQSEEWRKDNGQYVPYPSTWLRHKRWEDDVSAPVTVESGGGVHSYDLDKILTHAKNNIPKFKGGEK